MMQNDAGHTPKIFIFFLTEESALAHKRMIMTAEILSVAVIGSSGGGQATLGHTDPKGLLQVIQGELQKIEKKAVTLSRALFVALEGAKSFDNVNENTDAASLYYIHDLKAKQSAYLHCKIHTSGALGEVNEITKKLNRKLAEAIKNKQIHGLICISCSVDVFSETLQAAADAGIPVTGTGGASISLAAANFGVRLVGNAGGSVANTSLTRAVSYTHALASDWNMAYDPWAETNIPGQVENVRTFRSILNACLPAFWAVCLLKNLLVATLPLCSETVSFGDSLNIRETILYTITVLENNILPTACALVMATSSSASFGNDTSTLSMAGVVASTVCWQSVLGGLLVGWMIPLFQQKALFWCIANNIPATMTQLVVTGGVGAVISLVHLPMAPILRQITSSVRWIILKSITNSFVPSSVAAFIWGCFCCYGSKIGLYHAVLLPMILVEMECGDASFVGALDELALVLVCAGVCFGNLVVVSLFPKEDILSEADVALCKRAVRINSMFGDFIEASYPFTERHKIINIGCYLGGGLSSSLLVFERHATIQMDDIPKASAYLPWPVTVWLAGHAWKKMLLASIVAFGVPCLTTILNHSLIRRRKA